MILPYGQAPAPASLSVQAGSGKASQISVTYGPHGSGSFWSAVLTQSLASRLREKTDSLGSTLFRLTWKERVTPSGRVIPALRATGHRTSGRDCTSWRSPQEHDKTVRGNTMADHHHYPHDLSNAAQMASWPTPNTMDRIERKKMRPSREARGSTVGYLSEAVVSYATPLTSWVSPQKGDGDRGHQAKRYLEKKHAVRLGDQSLLTASGPTPNGSGAATRSTGQLNPSMSRWLMGLPIFWDIAAMKVDTSSCHSSRKRKTGLAG